MAETLTEFPMNGYRARGGRLVSFMDGCIYRLTREDIGDTTLPNLRTQASQTAKRLGKICRVHMESREPLVVILQARPRAKREAEAT